MRSPKASALGRIAYVAIDKPDDSHEGPHPGDNTEATARSVLYGALQHVGAKLSTHEMITAEQEAWGSIDQLAAEYETIAAAAAAAAAQRDRWALLVSSSGLTNDEAEAAIISKAFGALTAELRRRRQAITTSRRCCRASSERVHRRRRPRRRPHDRVARATARPLAQAGPAKLRA